MEYEVVTVEDRNLSFANTELVNEVNALLKKGWKLQGGVSVSCHVLNGREYYNLAQALVRIEDKTYKNNDVQVTLL